MANIASARKRARQSEKRRTHNVSRRSLLRSSIKKVVKAIEAKDAEGAGKSLRAASSVIDRVANKGLIHKNKASRHKRRLNARLKALATPA